MRKRKFIFIGLGIGLLIGIGLMFYLFFRDTSNVTMDLKEIAEQFDKVKGYKIELDGTYSTGVILLDGTVVRNGNENSVLVHIQKSDNEDQSTTLEYVFDYETSSIYQKIYYNDVLLAENDITQTSELYVMSNEDSTELLPYFASFLKQDSMECTTESCMYRVSDSEKNQLAMYLNLITFGAYTNTMNDTVTLNLNYEIDLEEKRLTKVTLDYSNGLKANIYFSDFLF